MCRHDGGDCYAYRPAVKEGRCLEHWFVDIGEELMRVDFSAWLDGLLDGSIKFSGRDFDRGLTVEFEGAL